VTETEDRVARIEHRLDGLEGQVPLLITAIENLEEAVRLVGGSHPPVN
jgi:hypothetical protein